MGIQSTVLSGAWVVGPVIGGYLADLYGARNAFYLAGLGIGLCSMGYSTLPETLQARGTLQGPVGAADDGTHGRGVCSTPKKDAGVVAGAVEASTTGAAVGDKTSGGDSTAVATYMNLLSSHNVQALSALATASAVGQACFMSVVTMHARHLWEAGAADLGLMFSLMGVCVRTTGSEPTQTISCSPP